MNKYIILTLGLVFLMLNVFGQKDYYKAYKFNEADTLRGMLRAERTCYDVTHYNLNIEVAPTTQSIEGHVKMEYKVLEDFKTLQVDLYKNMEIVQILYKQNVLKYRRVHDAVFIDFEEVQKKGKSDAITIFYKGKPTVATNPPWDGGFVWAKDGQGKDWIGVACEGDGASMWWPNKDHLSDEPDSVLIQVTVPKGLICVANGNLRKKTELKNNKTQFDWAVTYPINNYNVTVNIADYANFKDVYTAKDGEKLDLDYYVLKENLEKAKKHFKEVHLTLESFEHFFGKYPFWEDGFGMVETPYLGMEHQGAIAYGNKYMRGYLGGMLPRGIDFDYIIVHETGHEYFGNSISANDIAEMWIHESFTTYMESLFVEYKYDYKAALRYLKSQRFFIRNKEPIVGPLNVNFDNWEGGDHYYKGAWILHTLRHAIADDEKWWAILKTFHEDNKIQNLRTGDFIKHLNKHTNKDYTKVMTQYLYHPTIPKLMYKLKQKGKKLKVEYKWDTQVKGFDMPIQFGKVGAYKTVSPSTDKWQKITLKGVTKEEFRVAKELFLVDAVLAK